MTESPLYIHTYYFVPLTGAIKCRNQFTPCICWHPVMVEPVAQGPTQNSMIKATKCCAPAGGNKTSNACIKTFPYINCLLRPKLRLYIVANFPLPPSHLFLLGVGSVFSFLCFLPRRRSIGDFRNDVLQEIKLLIFCDGLFEVSSCDALLAAGASLLGSFADQRDHEELQRLCCCIAREVSK